jgi:hypothetical protein
MIEIAKIALIGFIFSALVQRKKSIFSWYNKIIKKLPWYLYFPLGGCYLCVTGELMLWYFIFKDFIPEILIDCLFFISAGISVAMIYNKIYCWLK